MDLWVGFVTYFSLKGYVWLDLKLGEAGMGATIAHRPLLGLLHMKLEARGQRELRDDTSISEED